MDGGIEAAGDVATGALIGRAVEPRHGEAHGGEHGAEEALCLNCGTALVGSHCHRCGQSAHVHRSFSAIGHDLLHGVVHFEGKLWTTLPMLAWRPGELTRRYAAGERARFVSPMALFLFSIFTLFAVFQIAGIAPPADLGSADQIVEQSVKGGSNRSIAALEIERSELKADIAAYSGDTGKRAAATARIAEIDREKAELSDLPKFGGMGEGVTGTIHTGWARLDHGIEKMRKNPSLALYKLQSNSYKFSWLLIPLSLPFVSLMFFWKRQYHAYDHAVFVTYSIAFMTLLFIVITVLGAIGIDGGWLSIAALWIPPMHIYRQLRGAYRLRRSSAALRTLAMLAFVMIVLMLFITALLALGLVG